MKKIILLLLIITGSATLPAQSDSLTQKNKAEFRIGTFYTSALHYYGRTDSLKSQGFFPLLEIQADKYFYLNAAPVFVFNPAMSFSYAGTVATIGYRFGREKKDAGHFYFSKPFYTKESRLVQSALKAQGAFTYTWLNPVLNITGGGDIKLSDDLDYGVTAGIDHLFRAEPGSNFVLVINPTATVNAGTQRFSQTYYKKNNLLFLPGTEQEVTENVKKFNILSYEFSMPVVVAIGKFQLILIPSYVLPQNLVQVPGQSEKGENLFTFTAGTRFIF